MKKLLLILFLIPSLLCAQTKEVNKIKNINDAETILTKAEVTPPRGGGWKLVTRTAEGLKFKAINGLSGSLELICIISKDNNKLNVYFALRDPQKIIDYLVIDKDLIVAKSTGVLPFIGDPTPVAFGYYKNVDLISLNQAFLPDNSTHPITKDSFVNFGRLIATNSRVIIGTRGGVATWYLNNQEALFAGAYVLARGIIFDNCLSAIN